MHITSHVDDLEKLIERNASSDSLIIFGTGMYTPFVYFGYYEPVQLEIFPTLLWNKLTAYSKEARRWFRFIAGFIDRCDGFTTTPEIAGELGSLLRNINKSQDDAESELAGIRSQKRSYGRGSPRQFRGKLYTGPSVERLERVIILLEKAARVIDKSVSNGLEKFRELPSRDDGTVYAILSEIADYWADQYKNHGQSSWRTNAATESRTVIDAIFFAALTDTKVLIFSNRRLSLFFLRNIYSSILSDELFERSRTYGIMHEVLPELRECDVEIVYQPRRLLQNRGLTAAVNLSTAYLRREFRKTGHEYGLGR